MKKLVLASTLLAATALAQPKAGAPATPAASAQKTIILVHGAFADGSSWDKVVPTLLAKGYNVVALHEPLSSLADDVAATTRAIEQAPGDVILVGHSYGGVIITEAGNNPKVTGLVYVAAFGPDAGESITTLGKGQPVPAWQPTLKVDSGGFATLPPESVAKYFAQDLPAADSRLLAVKEGPTSVKVFDGAIKTAAWKTKPSWYIRAEDDKMIDPNGEAMFAKRMKATTTSIKGASHVVMLSHAKEVANVILTAAAAPAKK